MTTHDREVDIMYNGAPKDYEDEADYFPPEEIIFGEVVA